MQIIDVVNDCLGSMGEAPLNSLSDPHRFRGAAQRTLERYNRRLQSRGWWFNRETLTLDPGALDSNIYLPGDTIAVRDLDTGVAQRGDRLYNLETGDYVFTAPVEVTLIRLVPFDEVPEVVAQYIAAAAVAKFQTLYDGDTAKARDLKEDRDIAQIEATAQETRESRANMIHSNLRLQRIKFRARGVRPFTR